MVSCGQSRLCSPAVSSRDEFVKGVVMSVLRLCVGASRAPSRVALLAPVLISFGLGACASSRSEAPQSYWRPPVHQTAEQTRVAGYQGAAPAISEAPAVEDDGLPPQMAPQRRPGPVQDDPAEPFSPNYGRPAAIRKSAAFSSTADGLPADLPLGFRAKLAAAHGR